jgi:hypothetical protein
MEGSTLQEGVPVRLLRVWYQGVNVKVRVNDVLSSSSFETKVGVRQGDIFINGIEQKVKEDGDGGGLVELHIPVLLFADDMVLMTDVEEELK